MKVADIGLTAECFTHLEDGTSTTWAVTALTAYLRALPDDARQALLHKIPVEASHAAYCCVERGAEEHRLQRLLYSPEALAAPIIFVVMPEGRANSHLLVDGTHRYIVFWRLGMPEILAYMVPYEQAKQFIVDDAMNAVPADLISRPSGL